MTRSDMYRQYAQECLALASRFTSTEEIRACLLTMAHAWHRLAQDEELASALLEDRSFLG